jgi:hypothetical protein
VDFTWSETSGGGNVTVFFPVFFFLKKMEKFAIFGGHRL